MKKFTDEQIIKAMQCVIGNSVSCSECEYQKALSFPSCRRMCAEQALDLINRKKAENKRLLQKLQQAKSAAIKEFAERLRAKAEMYNSEDAEEGDLIDDLLTVGEIVEIIDNLVKETTEEEK